MTIEAFRQHPGDSTSDWQSMSNCLLRASGGSCSKSARIALVKESSDGWRWALNAFTSHAPILAIQTRFVLSLVADTLEALSADRNEEHPYIVMGIDKGMPFLARKCLTVVQSSLGTSEDELYNAIRLLFDFGCGAFGDAYRSHEQQDVVVLGFAKQNAATKRV